MNILEKIRNQAQSTSISIESWIASFTGIILIRIFLEQYAYIQPNHFILLTLTTIIHYIVFFLAARLSILLILTTIGELPIHEAGVISIFGLLSMLLGPLIDMFSSGIDGSFIGYPLWSLHDLVMNFFTFGGFDVSQGVTLGVRIGLACMFTFLFLYIKNNTKSTKKAFLTAFCAYTAVFLIACIPALMNIAYSLHLVGQNIPNSIISSNLIINTIHPEFSAASATLINMGFDKLMIILNLLVSLVAGFLLFFFQWKRKVIVLFKNTRLILLQYIILIILGLSLYNIHFLYSPVNILIFLMTCISFSSAWIVAVCQNDIEDEKIDQISNHNRPLVTGELTKENLASASHIFLIIALISGYAAGSYILFFVIFSLFLSYIYSKPPLRLRRIPILAGTIIGLASLAAVLTGFFMASTDKNIGSFPPFLALAIFICFTLISNMKDIKDVEGDRAAGITTVPMLIGVEKFKKISAGFLCLFYFAAAFYLSVWFFIPAIIASILSWKYITGPVYAGKKRIIVFLSYLILIIIFLAIHAK